MSRTEVDERIVAHLGFARAVASRALDPRCRGADREDLVAWGVVGLVQAAHRYRDDAGAPFAAYAARRVRGQVRDSLRERDPLTRSARRAYREAREQEPDLPPPVVEVSLDRCIAAGLDPVATARAAGPGFAGPGRAPFKGAAVARASVGIRVLVAARPGARRPHRCRPDRGRAEQEAASGPDPGLAALHPPSARSLTRADPSTDPSKVLGRLRYDVLMRCD
jgi:RNA polymerase sigma factor (sigma-70 family)